MDFLILRDINLEQRSVGPLEKYAREREFQTSIFSQHPEKKQTYSSNFIIIKIQFTCS